jgi:hypothetical protein
VSSSGAEVGGDDPIWSIHDERFTASSTGAGAGGRGGSGGYRLEDERGKR